MADNYKFRIDHHGSLVRPAELHTARAAFAAGTLDGDSLAEVENQAVSDAVTMQRKLNLSVVTDGEFRRTDFRSAVISAVSGFAPVEGNGDGSGFTDWEVADKVQPTGTLVADQVAFAASQTLIAPKASLPSPAYLVAHAYTARTAEYYASPEELGAVLAGIIRDEIDVLVARGVKYIQLDNPDYARFYGPPADGWTPSIPLEVLLGIDAAVVELVDRPEDVRIALAPDWGEHRNQGIDRGIAEQVLGSLPYDRLLLPHHTQQIVDQDLVSLVPKHIDLALGVVNALSPELEDVDDIMARFDAAADVKDLEDLAVSPHRGFEPASYRRASMSIEEQRKKLELVETIARMCWGNEL
jgi:5-methyltetrahydropteroyltriglutamate--homocysteine methyltransferase